MSVRQFLQTSVDARNSVRELLQLVFTAELISPSRCLWIVSPWLRDVPVLDNTTGSFSSLGSDFPRSEVRLSRVLQELMTRGSHVVIATRPEAGNRQLTGALESGGSESFSFLEKSELHAKGIVGDAFWLTGSMNLTYNGIDHLTEMLNFGTAAGPLEQLRLAFRAEYGGLP